MMAIGGGLSFGGYPNTYQSAYENALGLNQQNYDNILAGYQQLMGTQDASNAATQARYDALVSQVLQTIQGIGSSQTQEILDAAAAQSGTSAQDMINRGLGNTTIQNSVQQGIQLNKQKALNNLASQIASLTAGYQSQLGSQAAGFSNTASQQHTGLGVKQLDWMNSISAPYPQNRFGYGFGGAGAGMGRGATGYAGGTNQLGYSGRGGGGGMWSDQGGFYDPRFGRATANNPYSTDSWTTGNMGPMGESNPYAGGLTSENEHLGYLGSDALMGVPSNAFTQDYQGNNPYWGVPQNDNSLGYGGYGGGGGGMYGAMNSIGNALGQGMMGSGGAGGGGSWDSGYPDLNSTGGGLGGPQSSPLDIYQPPQAAGGGGSSYDPNAGGYGGGGSWGDDSGYDPSQTDY